MFKWIPVDNGRQVQNCGCLYKRSDVFFVTGKQEKTKISPSSQSRHKYRSKLWCVWTIVYIVQDSIVIQCHCWLFSNIIEPVINQAKDIINTGSFAYIYKHVLKILVELHVIELKSCWCTYTIIKHVMNTSTWMITVTYMYRRHSNFIQKWRPAMTYLMRMSIRAVAYNDIKST